METPITGTLPDAPTSGHATIQGTPRPVLICARALGMNATEVRMRLPEDAIERLARELTREDGP